MHVTLDTTQPAYTQYVDCNTREKGTNDLLITHVKDAYSTTLSPALGKHYDLSLTTTNQKLGG